MPSWVHNGALPKKLPQSNIMLFHTLLSEGNNVPSEHMMSGSPITL